MVNVPPLLCSTPPPIDFGEDDDDSGLQSTLNLDDGDDFSDFGLVTDTHEVELNTKGSLPPLPRLTPQPEPPISEYDAQPPDLCNGFIKPQSPSLKATVVNAKQTVEAFNYQIKVEKQLAQDFGDYQDVAPPTPPPLPTDSNELEEQCEDEEEPNTQDNVPSLKLDSLSLYSSESMSAASTLSPRAVGTPTKETTANQQTTKVHPLCHQVTLEDVTDDSDEECSPRKPKELFIHEGAEDFFAIEVVATPTLDQPPTKLCNGLCVEQTESSTACDTTSDFNAFEEAKAVAAVNNSPPEDAASKDNVNDVDDDDFDDFADFSVAPMIQSASEPSEPLTQSVKTQESADDGFDDFQDFASSAVEMVPTELFTDTAQLNANDIDDDDDFGDFSEPSICVTAKQISVKIAVPPPPPPAAAHLSITERVKPVLELMFPSQNAATSEDFRAPTPLARTQTLPFDAIEQAHALNYQWSNSEMRHALVRSLAIDSRNILFGDKWNANMPRFAANLSCDPLKPLKPSSATAAAPAVENPLAGTTLDWHTSLQPSSSSAQTVEGLDATATETGEAEAQSGTSYGQKSLHNHVGHSNQDGGDCEGNRPAAAEFAAATETVFNEVVDHNTPVAIADSAAAPSAFAVATAATALSTALPADGDGYCFDSGDQQHQQHVDLRSAAAVAAGASANASNGSQPTALLEELVTTSSYSMPLKETHIYTPSKSDTVVAKTTTLAPVNFDFEIAAAGIIIDETVVKKEYRDVEYKPPPFGVDSPSKLSSPNSGNFEATSNTKTQSATLPIAGSAEDDDFSDFQSMPAAVTQSMKATAAAAQPPRNGTPTFGEHLILSPAILLPQAIPLAKPTIEWGDSSLTSINAEELARIEELFPQAQQNTAQPPTVQRQQQAPTISATLSQQHVDDDDWSDFVSVPVQQQQQQQLNNLNNNNNNSVPAGNGKKSQIGTPKRVIQAPPTAVAKDDDWSDFVSSTPIPPSKVSMQSMPQFNSGAWQSANFYNNPMSLYQQQQQATHSNLVPKFQNFNSNNNNNQLAKPAKPQQPQQIHIMHDFSTVPVAGSMPPTATYQQQHHQHHQQQLQQQQRQQASSQFQIGNAKVAPRISLIPDLSFVAPVLPTHAGAFMNSLPKSSFSAKK